MKGYKLAACAAAAMLLVSANSTQAQKYAVDFGINGGGSIYTSSLTESHIPNSVGDLGYKGNWLVGTQLTWWASPFHFGPRFGLRLNGTYTDNEFQQHVSSGTNNLIYGDVNLWSGSLDLMFGFKSPRDTWSGMEFLPYLALGGGIKWQNPAADLWTITDTQENKSWNGVPFACGNGVCTNPASINRGAGQVAFFLSEANSPMGLIGLGGDLRLAPNFAIRLEVGDRIWKAPIVAANFPAVGATTFAMGSASATTNDDSRVGKMVNELYGQVGLHMLFGLSKPAPVAIVAPAPAPPPAPVAPAPVERTAQVCVIDPSGTAGYRTVTTYTTDNGEPMVDMNGNRVAFTTTYRDIQVAPSAQWFVQGQPLTFRIGNEDVGYVTYGSSRTISGDDLAYLGTVNGLPVYADRDDIGSWDLGSSRGDLNSMLSSNQTWQTGFQNVRVLYVPMQPTGCVFQALQRQEKVRKQTR